MFDLLQVEAVVVWDEPVSLDLDEAGELDGHSAHCPLRFRIAMPGYGVTVFQENSFVVV
jgi:hypothetical protein